MCSTVKTIGVEVVITCSRGGISCLTIFCLVVCCSEVKENGLTEEEAVRDPTIYRETREKEEVYTGDLVPYNTTAGWGEAKTRAYRVVVGGEILY